VLSSYEVLAERPHATELPQAVTRSLGSAGVALKDVEGVALDIGPGSFTGLRIGLAFVKALLFHTRRPLIGVSSLDVLAASLPTTASQICPLLDAKQRKVYAAVFRATEGGLIKRADYTLCPVNDVPGLLDDGPVVFTGDGAGLYEPRLRELLGDRARVMPPDFHLPRAATLGRLGLARLRQGHQDDPRDLVPMYLYPMTCTIRVSDRAPGAPRKEKLEQLRELRGRVDLTTDVDQSRARKTKD